LPVFSGKQRAVHFEAAQTIIKNIERRETKITLLQLKLCDWGFFSKVLLTKVYEEFDSLSWQMLNSILIHGILL